MELVELPYSSYNFPRVHRTSMELLDFLWSSYNFPRILGFSLQFIELRCSLNNFPEAHTTSLELLDFIWSSKNFILHIWDKKKFPQFFFLIFAKLCLHYNGNISAQ